MYNQGKILTNPYTNVNNGKIGEPDIRSEIKGIISDENRGSLMVYRRARRDEQGKPIPASSRRENRSREIVHGIPSNDGQTMGYLFDDHIIRGYIDLSSLNHHSGTVKPYGDSRVENKVVFLEYDCLSRITENNTDMPDQKDQIILPKIDLDGNILSPLQASEIYTIGTVEHFRLDGAGRIEYHKLSLISKPEKSFRL